MKKFKKSKKRLLAAQDEPAQKEGKKPSKTMWIGIFIAAIMILSGAGFLWKGGDSTNLKYNGFSFALTQDNRWAADIGGQQILFYRHPSELENINMSPESADILRNTKMIYVTSDPDDLLKDAIGLSEFDMKDIMEKKGIYFVYAFTKENQFNKTIITCSNATRSVPVIFMEYSNQTEILYDNNCITLGANSDFNMLMLRDRLLYEMLGVMK